MDEIVLQLVVDYLGCYGDLAALRLTCREAHDAMQQVRFSSAFLRRLHTVPLASWRRSFPSACECNIQERNDLKDADFVHLAGIHTLNMSRCNQEGITDTAFSHLTSSRIVGRRRRP